MTIGAGSFTFKYLALLLKSNPNITVLSLSYVRKGIYLDELSDILPNLKQLTIQSSIDYLTIIHGTFSGFKSLEKFSYFAFGASSLEISSEGFGKLIKTLHTNVEIVIG